MRWEDLIGMKIVAFRGYEVTKGEVRLDIILFDDQQTYLELREQDRYDYHDYDNSARTLNLRQDGKIWAKMFNKEEGFREPTRLGYSSC